MNTAPHPLLSVEGLSLNYGRIRAVRNVGFSLNAGQVIGLCGHNGAGKSSIVRMLSGQIVPDAGRIVINGHQCHLSSVRDAQAHGITLVDQELSVISALTIAENLALGESGLGISGRLPKHAVLARLAAVGLPDVDPSTMLDNLTIGQRQLIEIARALGRNAQIFILDEPTATLTSADIAHVFRAIRAVTSRGCSVIYVSHRLDEVLALCDRIVVLRDGEIVADRPRSDISGPRLVELMLGHVPEASKLNVYGDAVMRRGLEVRGLHAGVVRNLDFNAGTGAITAFTGQVGSGTGDVLRALAGLAADAKGRAKINGRALPLGSPRRALAAGVGYVSSDRKGEGLFLSRSIAENLVSTRLPRIATAGILTPGRLRVTARGIAANVGVDGLRIPEAVSRLSGGNQQKVFLGRCLDREDLELVLLDEPTRGVDVGGRAAIHDIIRRIAARGVVVIISASDIEEVLELADWIYVLREGGLARSCARSETDSASLLSDVTRATDPQIA
jgi:ABC-type sugar transport system ATPase subunit